MLITLNQNKFIGVDPSFRKGGFWACVIDRDTNTAEFIEVLDLGFFALMLMEHQPRHVTVENSNLQSVSFDVTGSAMVVVKKARDVGKNMAISQCAADIAQKFTTIKADISPKQKGAKAQNEKVFQGIVRSQGLTLVNYKGLKGEQDKRDALMLALIAEQQWKLQSKIKK
jgi:hypothetical protein